MFDRARLWLSDRIAPDYVKQKAANELATTILSGIPGGGLGRRAPASTVEILEAYNNQPWLRAVTHKISHAVSTVTWRVLVARNVDGKAYRINKLQHSGDWHVRQRLMRSMVQRKEVELVEIEDHPLINLLNEGSEFFPGVLNMQLTQAYIDLVGEGFQLKSRQGSIRNPRSGRGLVNNLVPIPPHWVTDLPTVDDPNYYIRFGLSHLPEPVPSENVVYYRDPNPRDPFGRGSGTARSLGDELQANEAASKTIRTRLENNAIPPFIAMPDTEGQGPSDDQIERLRDSWQRRLRGPDRGGFVHFLKTRLKFEKLGNTFEELALIPLLQNQRDTIIQVYGAPPELFGILANSNRATIEAAETLFARHVVVPRIEFIRAVLQMSLIPEFDERLILDFESPVPEDKEHQLNVVKASPWVFKANEIREMGGHESLGDEGEVHGLPINLILQSTLTESEEEEPEEEPEEPPEDEPDDEEPPEDEPEEEESLARAKNSHATANQIAQTISDNRANDKFIPHFREAIREAGERRMRELLGSGRSVKQDEPDAEIGIAFDIEDPNVVRIIAEEAGEQIVGINNRTRRAVRRTLREGIENGEDINSLARRLRGTFEGFKGRRSVTIARTESIRALNAGQVAATKQAGFEGKQWLSTRDERVRETHSVFLGLDGQIKRVDEEFESPSGATGMWPGDMSTAAESVNCRCTTISVPFVSDDPTAEEDSFREFPLNTDPDNAHLEAQEWGREKYSDWKDNLTNDEREVVNVYASSAFRRMNRRLRSGESVDADEIVTSRIKILNSALSKGRTPENVVVWRGGPEVSQMVGTRIDDITQAVGREFVDRGFTSTSLDRIVAEDILGSKRTVLYKIRVPKNSRAAMIDVVSESAESELLLSSGAKFRIVNVFEDQKQSDLIAGRTPKKVTVVELEYIGSEPTSVKSKYAKRLVPEGREDKYRWEPGDVEIIPVEESQHQSSPVWPKWLSTEEKRIQYWRAAERFRLPIERRFRKVLRDMFDDQEEVVIAALKRLVDSRSLRKEK